MRPVRSVSLPTRRRSSGSSRQSAVAAVGLGLALLAAGCSGSGGTAAGTAPGQTVTVAVVPGIDNAPLAVAQHDGMFAAAGVTVQIKDYPSAAAELQALTHGQAGIAAGDYGDLFYAQARAADFRIVADGYDATAGVEEILTLPNSPITGPAQLAKQQIAVPNTDQLATPAGDPISLATAAATSVLDSYGVDTATVRWDPMSPAAEVAALGDGKAKAILVPEPYIYEAESKFGAAPVLDAYSGATADLPLSGYFTTNAFARRHSAAVADFGAALTQAQQAASLVGPVQGLLPGYANLTAQQADLVTIGSYPTSTNADKLQRVAQLLFDEGMLANSVVVAPMIIH